MKKRYEPPTLEVIPLVDPPTMLAAVSKANATKYDGSSLEGSKAIATDIKEITDDNFSPMAKKNDKFNHSMWD
jgi:hypothetical protein